MKTPSYSEPRLESDISSIQW